MGRKENRSKRTGVGTSILRRYLTTYPSLTTSYLPPLVFPYASSQTMCYHGYQDRSETEYYQMEVVGTEDKLHKNMEEDQDLALLDLSGFQDSDMSFDDLGTEDTAHLERGLGKEGNGCRSPCMITNQLIPLSHWSLSPGELANQSPGYEGFRMYEEFPSGGES